MQAEQSKGRAMGLRLDVAAVALLPDVVAVVVLFVHEDHAELADVAAALRGHQAVDPVAVSDPFILSPCADDAAPLW